VRLPGDGGDVEMTEVFAGHFLELAFAFEELRHRRRDRRLRRHVMIERRHEPRHPADTAFEEGEAQRREAVEHAAEYEARGGNHVGQRKAQRCGKKREAFVALAAYEPRMAVLVLVNACARMN